MLPNVERGYSFKGVTAYLMHDKREGEEGPQPETSERVDFYKLNNFIGDEARDPEEAAKIMALIVRDADKLKREAGIAATGRKATAPPVWHFSLSWHPTERPSQAEIERAAEAFLKRYGLDERYLSYIVGHSDTDHVHVHGVVCLVDPVTGKQANPYFDKQKAQAWAGKYERERGKIFCHNREARLGAIEREKASHATRNRAAFNDNSRGSAGGAGAAPDRFGRSRERTTRQDRKGLSRPEWQARQAKSREAKEAADRIKADTAAKWHSLKTAERQAFERRGAEFSRLMADRKAGREAIYEKYRSALDGIWKPEGGPRSARPDRSRLFETMRDQQARHRQRFEANEQTALGRVRNALTLAGKNASLFRTARLALDPAERRRLFEREQRLIAARTLPREHRARERPTPKTPEPKRVQAERLKAMRAKELAEYTRETGRLVASMKARHDFQRAGEKDGRAMLGKAIGAAWEQHRAAYGQPERAKDTAEATRQDRQGGQEKHGGEKRDRFGRSRDRQRQPRPERETAKTDEARETANNTEINAEAENPAVERGLLSGQFHAAENQKATPEQPEAAREGNSGQEQEPHWKKAGWSSAEEREAAIRAIEEQWARSREADKDSGRTL